MPRLIDHARAELNRIGLPNTDPALCASLLAAVDAFSSYGHSGGSAAWAVDTLHRLLQRQPLTPITSDPDEWELVRIPGAVDTWQNRRDSRCLSHDGGRTHFVVGPSSEEWPVVVTPSPADAAMLTAPDPDHFQRNTVARRMERAAVLVEDPDQRPSSFIDWSADHTRREPTT